MMTEKSEAISAATSSTDSKTVVVVTAHQQQVHHGRQSVNRPPTSALIGQHHHQHHHHHQPPLSPSHHQPVQPPLNLNRSGSSLSVTDYREPAITPTVIALESVGGGGRRVATNGSVSNVICGGGPNHPTHAAVWHPRPIYPFPLPLTNATALWHHAQPHFPTPSVTFPPFIENEWSRHCRLPIFNQELRPEPVNLQNNHHHHRRTEPGRALDIAGRLQQERAAHNRPALVIPPAHDDREQTRHHA
ncbi:PREDICTED: uncharacterized protein LOC107173196 [Diuraphis noxia]|uniref:uncharacterized protein LOC107173196 n=1 Tax=Diuraphis noxia TaxID=143948 RepID=UPI0007639695|nr:PREDICTED: uncharacterized protein LOC107173196 [Diuraphis noxia]XP_015379112.1 PREDICTED: uncharacterized protein LOC107173196 [Diuraphis noxia]XP_015379113.1 PREDICTED: uncharacterized protein LOC107173196 [Diuraphis noxia]